MRMTPVTPKKSAIKAPCHDAGKFTRTGSASHRGTKSKATPRTIKKSNPYLLRSSFRKSGDKWGQSPIIASRITKRDCDPTYFLLHPVVFIVTKVLHRLVLFRCSWRSPRVDL